MFNYEVVKIIACFWVFVIFVVTMFIHFILSGQSQDEMINVRVARVQ